MTLGLKAVTAKRPGNPLLPRVRWVRRLGKSGTASKRPSLGDHKALHEVHGSWMDPGKETSRTPLESLESACTSGSSGGRPVQPAPPRGAAWREEAFLRLQDKNLQEGGGGLRVQGFPKALLGLVRACGRGGDQAFSLCEAYSGTHGQSVDRAVVHMHRFHLRLDR